MAISDIKEKCRDCKYFRVDYICKRYPKNYNKHPEDFCGEFVLHQLLEESIPELKGTFESLENLTVVKRGRKPKNA